MVLYIHGHVYRNIHWIIFVTTSNSAFKSRKQIYMKSKSKNITTSINASRDLLTTQATMTIMSTNLFTTSMPTLLPTTTTK